ncbi:MAG: DNA-directed RNA polymerase subunit omega [Firmicutes bacterium]|nr:DNA-directed RNA polymerase subunit omega [Bacillota bacterium]
MIHPPFETLYDKVDSKYTLVVACAKRAREIVDGAVGSAIRAGRTNPVTKALTEIAEGKITWERTKTGIK